jgi:hypothetical protein
MKSNLIDWATGRVAYWALDSLDLTTAIEANLGDLGEDLAQVEYPNGVLLDIGWYPAYSADGAFQVVVVRQADWEAPLFKRRCRTAAELHSTVEAAVEVAKRASHRENC